MSSTRVPEPCQIVIFGASGDLTKRKLIPSLYYLYRKGMLNERFAILGISRTEFSDQEFRERMRPWCQKAHGYEDSTFDAFCEHLFYQPADPTNPNHFSERIATRIDDIHLSCNTGSNILFYLSVGPGLYDPIINNINEVGLISEGKRWCSLDRDHRAWQRIIVEKPFGHDLPSAEHLNRVLGRAFEEESIFRIDHYLGKETVQNITVFRFANTIFEPLWNRNYIDHIQITAAETVGVEGRGGYYDKSGALKDMIQSHLLQVMAVIAMEAPNSFKDRDLRSEQRKVLEAVADIPDDQVQKLAVRAQYTHGAVNGSEIPGYLAEDSVNPESVTDTYAALRLHIDNWRWRGVPFYLRTGKAMRRKLTQVVVYFKKPPMRIFEGVQADIDEVPPNRLVINIQPDEGIALRFDGKVQGEPKIAAGVMDFDYQGQFGGEIPEAYATLIYDALLGDQSLFKGREEIEAAWRIVAPVMEYWAENPNEGVERYAAGSWGPRAADLLFHGQAHWYNPEGESSREQS